MLKDTRVYLCGAMSYDEDQIEWREEIKPFLRSLDIRVFDPCDPPIDVGVEDKVLQRKLLREERYDELAVMMKEIRCIDLRMIDIVDFLIVNIDTRIYTAGTWEEIALANREKKPILVRCRQGKPAAPPWLFGMFPHELIFSSWSDLKHYLLEINDSEGVLLKRRWYLFDHSLT